MSIPLYCLNKVEFFTALRHCNSNASSRNRGEPLSKILGTIQLAINQNFACRPTSISRPGIEVPQPPFCHFGSAMQGVWSSARKIGLMPW